MGYNIIEKFENKFSEYIGSKYAIGTFYGRHAIYLALRTIDVKDKEVILPTFTCSVVCSSIILAGAKPIFVDTDINILTLNQIKDTINNASEDSILVFFMHSFSFIKYKVNIKNHSVEVNGIDFESLNKSDKFLNWVNSKKNISIISVKDINKL